MISGGNATVYVADMDNPAEFYSGTLALTLTNRLTQRSFVTASHIRPAVCNTAGRSSTRRNR